MSPENKADQKGDGFPLIYILPMGREKKLDLEIILFFHNEPK